MSPLLPRSRRALFPALLLAAAPAAAQAPADFSGSWVINTKLSDDVKSKVEAAAGPESMTGAHGVGGVGLLPRPGDVKEAKRVELRQFLLDRVGLYDLVDIKQTATDITIAHGDEDVRIFYFGREHVRNDVQGRKLRCRNRWDGSQLVIEEEGEDKNRVIQVLTAVPQRNQLIHNVRFENPALKEPLDLKLLYDRAPR
jgi:hypothetical protein